jgi:hypothetical protein
MEQVKRRLWLAFLFLTVGILTMAPSCEGVPDCRKEGCAEGRQCTSPIEGVWICTISGDPSPTPTPFPSPTPPPTTLPGPRDCRHFGCPTHGQVCVEVARDDWQCVTPTPLPTPTPTPQPTPTPTPQPTPTPCNPSMRKVCSAGPEGPYTEFDRTKCWTCADWLSYMMRNRDTNGDGIPDGAAFTPGDPAEDGDVGGHPGFWINNDGHGNLQFIGKKDCKNKNGALMVDYARAEDRVVPCPSPTPSPFPTPTPGPTPSPGPTPTPIPGGIHCTPLAHIGVAFHAQHPAPNGPLGYRWVFSATPKSRKPFCPENRNECEQQAYQGDPVNNYAGVVWRFDLRFQCQDPAGPLWNQQEPHTGDHWENTDVRQENNYLANLKPAVKGLHRVRTCTRDAPGPSHGNQGGNCQFAEKVAN